MNKNQEYLKRIDKLIQNKKSPKTPSNPNNTQSKRAIHFSQYPTITFYDPIRPELSRVICPDLNLYQAIEISKFSLSDELIAKEALAKKKLLIKMKNHLEARKKAFIPYPEISLIKKLVNKKSKKKGALIPIKVVSQIVGVSEQSVRKRCNKGLIPHYKGKGIKRYFYLKEILPLACEKYRKDHPDIFKL